MEMKTTHCYIHMMLLELIHLSQYETKTKTEFSLEINKLANTY